jgi:hypothetical protein
VTIDRRTFLRGAGGALIALPFLEAMRGGRARAATGLGGFPKRFVAVYTPNGVVPSKWTPTGTGTSFTLSPILLPLADHKANLLVLSGLDLDVTYVGPGDAHQKGMGGSLTGRPLLEGSFGGGGGTSAGFASGISVDQRMAQAIGQDTRFPSLELGVQVRAKATPLTRISYQGAGEPLPPESDPFTMFTRLFGNGADPVTLARLKAERQTVLQGVKASYDRIGQVVGADDRAKLEQHLEAVREIERRLTSGTDPGPACSTPDLGAPFDVAAAEAYPQAGARQMDLLAMALACDLTRVATLQWSSSGSAQRFPWLDVNDSHHLLSHSSDTDTTSQTKLTKIDTWYARQVAYLIAKLKSLPEGDGTVFDNTVILWFTELAKGNTHSRRAMHLLLAGSCGGHFRTGRHLAYSGQSHNNLLVSLLNAMDVPDTRFGHTDFCTGPLGNLT